MKHEEVKKRLFTNPWVREAYDNPPLPIAAARAVVERRKELGMTQEELAEKMGTSQAQVWRIESGAFNPTAKTLAKLEAALGISLGDLYREYQKTAQLSPREQLEDWRSTGLLLMSDEDFELMLEMKESSPGQLHRLIRWIMSIELDEGNKAQFVVRVKEVDEPESTRRSEQPRKLELSATL